MRTLVLGGDGYLGWPTAMHLCAAGHEVSVVDNFARRGYDRELGVTTLVPIAPLEQRAWTWQRLTGRRIGIHIGDLTNAEFTHRVLDEVRPDAVVHFAEQRSAPFSMIDQQHAVYTQVNNVVGTLNVLYAIAQVDPTIHLIKLGSMGEYGTPNIDIEEGWLEVTHKGRTDRMLYPKRPGSFYHLSKVHDSHNIEFACRAWNLRATDLNQGIVYGQETSETVLHPDLATRFDYDAVFGTVLNRMVVQAACRQPLTVYGTGRQIRGVLDIRDTVECIRIAAESPPAPGEFRVFNQFTEQFSVLELAQLIARLHPFPVRIELTPNPRAEAAEHYYHAAHRGLLDLGLRPHLLSDTLLESLFVIARRHRRHADPRLFEPTVRWSPAADRVGPAVQSLVA